MGDDDGIRINGGGDAENLMLDSAGVLTIVRTGSFLIARDIQEPIGRGRFAKEIL